MSKKVGILLAKGFEDVETITVADFLLRADIEVDLLSTEEKGEVKSAHGIKISTDKFIWNAKPKKYDAIYLPGGLPGAERLRDSEEVEKFIHKAEENGALIAAICAAPMALDQFGLLDDKKFVCYPGVEEELKNKPEKDEVLVKDGNLITAAGPMIAPLLAYTLIEELVDKKTAEKIQEETLFNNMKEHLDK